MISGNPTTHRATQQVIDSWSAESERLHREARVLERLAEDKKSASDKYAELAANAEVIVDA